MSAILDDNETVRGVQLSEFVRKAVRAEMASGVRSMIPCRVESVTLDGNGNIQAVIVKPLIKDWRRDETGALVVESVPIVNECPVQFLTGGGFTFTCPVARGTLGSIVFSDRSLDRYLAGSGQEVDPQIYTRNNLTDAVFVPGLMPPGASDGAAAPADHATAGSCSGQRIHFRSGTICIGDEPGDPIATQEDLGVLFNAINSATVTPTDGGASFKAAIIAFLTAAGWSSKAPDAKFGSTVRVNRSPACNG